MPIMGMLPEDFSQPGSDAPAEDFSLSGGQPVTAGATAPDNATPDTSNNTNIPVSPAPQGTDAPVAKAGEGGDEENTSIPAPPSKEEQMSDYQRSKLAFFASRNAAPQPAAQTPAPTPPPVVQTPPAPQVQTPVETEEEEFPSAPQQGDKPPQIKLRPVNPVDVQLLAGWKAATKAGSNLTLAQYVQQQAPAAPAAAAAPPPVTPPMPQEQAANNGKPATVAQVNQRLEDILAEKRQALELFDHDAVLALDREMLDLGMLKMELREAERQAEVEAQNQRAAEENRYLEQAGQWFPESRDPNGPLAKQAEAIFQHWVQTGDDRANHPSGYFYCYTEAAMALNIAPSGNGVRAPAQSQTSPPPPARHGAPVTAIIASGQATTTQPRSVEVKLSDENYQQQKTAFLTRIRSGARTVAA